MDIAADFGGAEAIRVIDGLRGPFLEGLVTVLVLFALLPLAGAALRAARARWGTPVDGSTVRIKSLDAPFGSDSWLVKPARLLVMPSGIEVVRGEEPQEDSFLQGRDQVRVPWERVIDVEWKRLTGTCRVLFHDKDGVERGFSVTWMRGDAGSSASVLKSIVGLYGGDVSALTRELYASMRAGLDTRRPWGRA